MSSTFIYGLIALQFTLKLIGARPGNGFAEFIASISRPYLLALVVYILIHLAINGAFRLVAHRKVTV